MVLFFKCGVRAPQTNLPIGIGLLEANTTYPIPLFKNEHDSIPTEILQFKTDKNGVTKLIAKLDVKPYEMFGGESHKQGRMSVSMGITRLSPVLKFRVIDSTQNTFTIITNEKTGQAFLIKKDIQNAYYETIKQFEENNCIGCPGSHHNPRWYIFETWERYLKRVEYIEKSNMVIYDQPEGKIIFENSGNKFLPFVISEVKGDWIKLKKGFGREFNFDDTVNYEGWTQWKDGNKILIKITEHSYE